MNIKDFSSNLSSNANKLNIGVTDEQIQKFYKYMEMMLEWNEKINLTAITEPSEVILKHFVDSITINKHIKNNSNMIDVGTGAGFPGIPMSIIREDIIERCKQI